MFFALIIADLPLIIICTVPVVLALRLTRRLGDEYAWVNRKMIHLSVLPAVFAYGFILAEPYLFSLVSFLFAFWQYWKRVRGEISLWYQLEENIGEVYYCLAFGVMSLVFWRYRLFAMALMLYLAVGDALTGIVRFFYLRRFSSRVFRRKHIVGSFAMFLTCFLVNFCLFGVSSLVNSIILATIATSAEYQSLIDDNIAIPLLCSIYYYFVWMQLFP